MFYLKILWWLDANCGPVLSEATAQAAEPQPLLNSSKTLLDLFGKNNPSARKQTFPDNDGACNLDTSNDTN